MTLRSTYTECGVERWWCDDIAESKVAPKRRRSLQGLVVDSYKGVNSNPVGLDMVHIKVISTGACVVT